MERRYSWTDPAATAKLSSELSGLDFFARMIDGRTPHPPIMETLAFRLVEAEPGRVVFEGQPHPYVYNPIGTVHGGWFATILDSAVSCAVHALLEVGQGYTTLELKTNFVRPATEATGMTRCEGKVIHAGRRAATSEAHLVAKDTGKLLAHATATCMIFEAWADRGGASNAAAQKARA